MQWLNTEFVFTYLFSDWGRKGQKVNEALTSCFKTIFYCPLPCNFRCLPGWTIIHWIPLSFSFGAQHVEMDWLAQLLKFSVGKAKSRPDMVRKGMTQDEGRGARGASWTAWGTWAPLPRSSRLPSQWQMARCYFLLLWLNCLLRHVGKLGFYMKAFTMGESRCNKKKGGISLPSISFLVF